MLYSPMNRTLRFAKSFILRTYRTPSPQTLYNQRLQASSNSVHSTRLTTPLESAVTRFLPPNPFRLRSFSKHGEGAGDTSEHGFTGCGNTLKLVIPRAGFARGICFFSGFCKKQIPCSARNDNYDNFFRNLFRAVSLTASTRLQPLRSVSWLHLAPSAIMWGLHLHRIRG
jgi:hypothetical protein